MLLLWILLAAALVFGLFWLSLRHHHELFYIRVESSQVTLKRGGAPPRLLADLKDVVKREKLRSGEIRVVVEGGAPHVLTQGLSPGVTQQVRNVVGTFKLATLRSASQKGR